MYAHLKGEYVPWGLKSEKYARNAESRIIDGPLTGQPDHEYDNPLKSGRTYDDVDKKNWPKRSSPDLGEFSPPEELNFIRIFWIFEESTKKTSW